jgi:spore photoproduct lyase
MKIKYQETKSLTTKPNNNSANSIAPNMIYGCFGGCVNTYCYMSRYNGTRVFVNTNVDDIFNSVLKWEKSYVKVPDQQDPVYKMVDIACNTDLVLMQRHMSEPLVQYLKRYDDHPSLNSTMATKYPKLLTTDVNHFIKKPRVRISMMPQKYSSVLEPNMQSISSRIQDINRLKSLGWEVHINYSPVIFYNGWEEEYRMLFDEVKRVAGVNNCEIIALTNHKFQMLKCNDAAKELMKYSSEVKNKSGVMRYPIKWKSQWIAKLINEYTKFFPKETIRYIF